MRNIKANFFGAERGNGLELTREATRYNDSSSSSTSGGGGGGGGESGGGKVGIDSISIFWWRLETEKGGGKMESWWVLERSRGMAAVVEVEVEVVVGLVMVKTTAKGKQRRRAQMRETGVGDNMV